MRHARPAPAAPPVPILVLAIGLALAPAAASRGEDLTQRARALPGAEDARIAREAVRRGDILPLEQILDMVAEEADGQVVEIELELEDDVWEYEVELLTPDGRLIEVTLDAGSGAVIGTEADED